MVEDLKVKVGLKYSDPTKEYEFLSKLGEGSYGSVIHAKHFQTHTEHAIKQVPVEDNLSDLLKETEHMMECKCQNIVGYDACYILNNQLWIVMEYCAGGSLADVMKLAQSTLSEDQIAVAIRDILQALVYLHDHNRIHRDIKAGNVLLTSQGVGKLADFGVSGTLSKETKARHTVIGTPFWMAPEVIQEVGHNYKADIWSLGITMIELAEGHPPLCNLHPMRAIFVIPSRQPPTFADKAKWSEEMNDFLAQCLTKDPNVRPSAKELLNHPWLVKKSSLTADVLKPLIDISDEAIRKSGSRDAALNALYEDSSDSNGDGTGGSVSSSASSADSAGTGPRKGKGSDDEGGDSDGSTQETGTVQIISSRSEKDDGDDGGSNSEDDEYSTMKINKKSAAAKQPPKPSLKDSTDSAASKKNGKKVKKDKKGANKQDSEGDENGDEESATVKIKSSSEIKKQKKAPKSSKNDSSSENVVEDTGTMQIKSSKSSSNNNGQKEKSDHKKAKSSSSNEGNAEVASTILMKKGGDPSSRMRQERLGTLARGESPRIRILRQDLEDLDLKVIKDIQAIKKQLERDRQTIASILESRKSAKA